MTTSTAIIFKVSDLLFLGPSREMLTLLLSLTRRSRISAGEFRSSQINSRGLSVKKKRFIVHWKDTSTFGIFDERNTEGRLKGHLAE